MKLKNIILLLLLHFSIVVVAQNKDWVYITSNKDIKAILSTGQYLWAGSAIGPILFNKLNGESKHFYSCNCNILSNNISDIEIDSKGITWFATETGLVKFDGSTWTTFNIPNSGFRNAWVNCISIDSNGNIWIGVWGGLAKFDGKNWISFNLPETGYDIDNVMDAVYDIDFDKNGDVWIAARHGVYVMRNNVYIKIFNPGKDGLPFAGIEEDTRDIAIDAHGNKWISTWAGLALYKDSTWTVFDTSNSGLPYNWVNSITIDALDNKWIGTWNGAVKFDGQIWSENYFSGNVIRKIIVENAQKQWFATYYGLAELDNDVQRMFDFSDIKLNASWISSIANDKNGIKWIGTQGGGLTKFDGEKWLIYNSVMPDLYINTIIINQNDMWIGTEHGGLVKFDGSNWTVFNTDNSLLPSNKISTIAFDGDIIWIGTDKGLVKFDGVNWNVYDSSNSELPSDDISKIAFSNGELWLATRGDNSIINFINENQCVVYDQNMTGVAPVVGIVIDKSNNKWFASNSRLVKFDGNIWENIVSVNIYSLIIDQNDVIWLGAAIYPYLYKYSAASGLDTINSGMDADIEAFCVDERNNLWVGSSQGTIGIYKEGGVDLDIKGTVLNFTGDSIDGGKAYLYNITNLTGGYDTVAKADIIRGKYIFQNIADCGYTIFTDPEVFYPDLLPSYLGDTILWMGSDTLNVHASTNAKTITLYEQPPQSSGKTTIIGDVESLLNTAGKKNGTKKRDPIDNAGVAITRKNKNAKGSDMANLVAYTKTDPDGRFKFENFEAGDMEVNDYYIFIDYPGIPMDTINKINKLPLTMPGDSLVVHASVNPDIIHLTSNIITKVDDITDHSGNLKIFPNPLKVSATFEFPNDGHESYEFKLLNMSGIIVKTINNITENNFVLMREDLDTGFYIFELRGDKKYTGKLLVE